VTTSGRSNPRVNPHRRTLSMSFNMATPSLEISALMKRVRAEVFAATHEKQVP
jgi:hypothetical protein